MKKQLIFTALLLIQSLIVFSQDLVKSGPMVGYSTMREALLWVQTTEKSEVHFEYFEKENPKKRFKTQKYTTQASYGFVGKLVADQILPGKEYVYELYINGKRVRRKYPMEFQSQTLWQWRTDPPEVNLSLIHI